MKKRLRTIYNCDYCGKHRHFEDAMRRHESVCTLNPDRNCLSCHHDDRVSMRTLIKNGWPTKTQADLRRLANCPMCLLSLARIYKVDLDDFDLKKALSDYVQKGEEYAATHGTL